MGKPGMSKHDITSFNESEAVNLLSMVLEENHKIKTFFSENDKTPNHDGFFELTDNENTPKKQFIVQIKKVEDLTPNTQGKNKGKYVYSLETNFLYYVKEKVTESPAIYFVVDISKKRIFWIYLSDELLMNLDFEGHETISYPFGEENILHDINKFTSELNQIAAKRNALFCHKSRNEIIELQDALDYINHLFDYDFYNIKTAMFPKLWRFGIRSSETPISIGVNGKMGEPVKSSIVALYPQMKGTLDAGIQEYSHDNSNIFNHISFGGKMEPMKYAEESVHKAIKAFFEQGIPDKYLPDIVLKERIWLFVEKTNKYFSKEKATTITIKELRLRLNLILKYVENVLTSKSLSEPELQFKTILTNQFLLAGNFINLASILLYATKESFFDFCEKEKGEKFSLHKSILQIIDLSSIELLCLIDEIEKRRIEEITPVWDYEVYTLRQMDREQFLKCINEITSIWLSNLPELYNDTYAKFMNTPKYKYNNRIVYENYCANNEGLNRFYNVIHKYKNTPFSIQYADNLSREFTEEAKQSGLSSIMTGVHFDEFIDHKLLYYESLRCLIYEGICEELGFKAKGLRIGCHDIKLFS